MPEDQDTPLAVDKNVKNSHSSNSRVVSQAAADDTLDDDGSAFGRDASSETTSLKTSILKYRKENGRTYHAYKDGGETSSPSNIENGRLTKRAYVLPNDEIENERLDLQHHLFLLTFDEKLHAAPLPKDVHRVFDAGCGTGIWAIEFGDEHPECEVVGIDLSPIQPAAIPPNVSFYVDDLEEPWDYSSKFDFIFARFLTGSIRNWPKFFEQSYKNLNSGGVVEMIDIIYPMQSDDYSLPEGSALYKWSNLLHTAFANNGTPMNSALKYKDQLEQVGFVDVNIVKRKWPQNRWPKDPKHKQIGIWANQNTLDALSALSLAVFTRPQGHGGLGWAKEEVETFLADVRKDINDVNIHAYWPM
ncbi:hypothetical protein NW762_013856 [Fusarium torreyae]|uniref:Methyltransferase n=1 Tax=Fusarium torreyae TaxID=1237075 RepID=A0A9W8RN56_9HYPO|nr:hypothetical protein NW762_013856 [Fusarium torreyae]